MTLIPVLRDEHSAPFFDAAAEGTLLLRFSPSSGEWSEPAALLCSVTQADDLEWRAASGTAELVTWTVKPARTTDARTKGGESASQPDSRPAPDAVIGIVELAEGPWLTLQLVDAEGAVLRAGLPVRISFVRPEGGEAMPVGCVTDYEARP
jgi:uncharacterized OB-fold protein